MKLGLRGKIEGFFIDGDDDYDQFQSSNMIPMSAMLQVHSSTNNNQYNLQFLHYTNIAEWVITLHSQNI